MSEQPVIPFNRPTLTGKELEYIADSVRRGKISGDGYYTRWCQDFIEERFGAGKCLLTTSGTAALEMAGLLAGIEPGDEIIMPSFTFVSTANAFIRAGARPVFADIRPDTLNLDEEKIEDKITEKTKAVVPVHYAGTGCEMERICEIAAARKLLVIEDAAQALNSRYGDRFLGTIGEFGAFSFHETKNVISGEGGAILINREAFYERAEIVWEKGTNRRNFFRGLVDKYTWVDVGSSYLPSEILAAFLKAQLENLESLQAARLRVWETYRAAFAELEKAGRLRRLGSSPRSPGNQHIFALLLPSPVQRDELLQGLKKRGILAVFHYLPLHDSPYGQRLGYRRGDFPVSEEMAGRLLRLPLFAGLTEAETARVVAAVKECLN